MIGRAIMDRTVMNPEIAVLLTELVEKVGLLRRDMLQKKDLEKYEARIAREFETLRRLIEGGEGFDGACLEDRGTTGIS